MKTEKDPLATTVLNLPLFESSQRDRRPGRMTWDEVMAQTGPQREFYMKHFDSPEKRLRNKNPAPLRMLAPGDPLLPLDKSEFDGPGGKLTNEEIDRIVHGA
jgi:hypothetical protein